MLKIGRRKDLFLKNQSKSVVCVYCLVVVLVLLQVTHIVSRRGNSFLQINLHNAYILLKRKISLS